MDVRRGTQPIDPISNAADARPSVWLLSAYRADSHAAWAAWLQDRLRDVQWQVFELPGKHFRWRIRGNPLSWLGRLPKQAPHCLLASSMVDLATLRGLHPQLAHVPAFYYFHENQFAYPTSQEQVKCLEPQMVQLYGALAADRILFNSAYNRDSFLQGVGELLARMPDAVPDGIVERLTAKSTLLPVPVRHIATGDEQDTRLIVWNHRWEYDKAPGLFADAMIALARRHPDLRLALLGPRPAQTPEALTRLRAELGGRIVADGHLDRPAYERLIASAAIVVSTAVHEFQGLAVMEATRAGCRPLVPDALCYPEQYPAGYRYPAGDVDALIRRLDDWFSGGLPAPLSLDDWSEERLLGRWQTLFAQVETG